MANNRQILIRELPEGSLEERHFEMRDAPMETKDYSDAHTFCLEPQWRSRALAELIANPPMIEFLEAEGLEVIPCPFRNNYKFGGSFHCATVDIRRRGVLESYF